MGVANKALKGGALLAVARIAINLLQGAATILVAWYLSPDDYGISAIAMTVVMIVTSLSEMQLGEALISHKTAEGRIVDTVWTLGMLRGVVLALILGLLAMPISVFFEDDRLFNVMLVIALQPFITGIINPRRFLQEREMIFRQEFIISVLQKLTAVAVTIGLAVWLESYWALVIGALAEAVAGVVISFVILPYHPRPSLSGVREIWGFSVWLTLGQLVNTINFRLEALLIGKFLGFGPLGIYRLGGSLAVLPTQELMAPVSKVAMSGFASVANNQAEGVDDASLRNAYQKAQSFAFAFALPCGVGFAMVAQTFTAALLAERWQPAVFIIQCLSPIFALQTLGALVHPLALAKGQTRLLFIRDTQMLFLRLPIVLTALYLWALPGIIGARVLTGTIVIAVNMVLVRRMIGLGVASQLRANLRALISVAVMAASLWLLQQLLGPETDRSRLLLRLFAEIAFGLVVYVACSTLLWRAMRKPEGPEQELLRVFRAVKARIKPA